MAKEHETGIDVRDSLYGFVASEPQLTHSEDGTARLYFKGGQEHYQYDGGNSYTKLPTTFHDVVAFKGAAKHGFKNLSKQDWFIAQGRVRDNANPNTGVTEEQFIANRLGHDMARTEYEVDRTPRRTAARETPERSQERSASFEEPEAERVDRESHAREL